MVRYQTFPTFTYPRRCLFRSTKTSSNHNIIRTFLQVIRMFSWTDREEAPLVRVVNVRSIATILRQTWTTSKCLPVTRCFNNRKAIPLIQRHPQLLLCIKHPCRRLQTAQDTCSTLAKWAAVVFNNSLSRWQRLRRIWSQWMFPTVKWGKASRHNHPILFSTC